jgi:hypothetical protein
MSSPKAIQFCRILHSHLAPRAPIEFGQFLNLLFQGSCIKPCFSTHCFEESIHGIPRSKVFFRKYLWRKAQIGCYAVINAHAKSTKHNSDQPPCGCSSYYVEIFTWPKQLFPAQSCLLFLVQYVHDTLQNEQAGETANPPPSNERRRRGCSSDAIEDGAQLAAPFLVAGLGVNYSQSDLGWLRRRSSRCNIVQVGSRSCLREERRNGQLKDFKSERLCTVSATDSPRQNTRNTYEVKITTKEEEFWRDSSAAAEIVTVLPLMHRLRIVGLSGGFQPGHRQERPLYNSSKTIW